MPLTATGEDTPAMALCTLCKQDMLSSDGCTLNVIVIGKQTMDRIPYWSEGRFDRPSPHDGVSRCHDCNAAYGRFHHPGCDVEECPKCHRQLLSCFCAPIQVFRRVKKVAIGFEGSTVRIPATAEDD